MFRIRAVGQLIFWGLVGGLAGLPRSGLCDPWIAPGDATLRHHVEVLADAHVIHRPITTWPLMWSGIASDIASADAAAMSPLVQQSLAYVRAAYQRQTGAGPKVDARLEAGRGPMGNRGFSDTRREQDEASVGLSDLGEHWAARAQLTVAEDPVDTKTYRPDGSYVAGFLGNWAVSAGWLDRWWGPGWQSSLIQSDNARPVPALTLQRNRADAFETPWLSWIGPWQFLAFAGELDGDDRFVQPSGVPDAKLIGARLTFKPLSSLELGISRNFQFGGKGRRNGVGSLLSAFVGHGFAGNSADANAANHGILEGGYDARWSFNLGPTESALYGQMIGQNATGTFPLPSRFMYLAGMETTFATGRWQHRFSLEGAQSNGNGFGANGNIYYNYIYEGEGYNQGLRYEGRPIGTSFDNDTRALALKGDHFLTGEPKKITWMLAYLNINMDGSNAPPPGGNVFGGNTKTPYALLSYSFPAYQRWMLTLGGDYYRRSLALHGQIIGSGVFARVELPL